METIKRITNGSRSIFPGCEMGDLSLWHRSRCMTGVGVLRDVLECKISTGSVCEGAPGFGMRGLLGDKLENISQLYIHFVTTNIYLFI